MRTLFCHPASEPVGRRLRHRHGIAVWGLFGASALLVGCSSDPSPDKRLGVSSSPRIVTASQAIPKGGGTYKLGKPYMIAGRWYTPRHDPAYDRTGVASWYGDDFHGRKTANGEIYDMNALTAAHPTLPMPSYAYVTNMQNGRTLLVRINDRGPYVGNRIIDLSRASARALGTAGQGLGQVRVRYAGRARLDGDDTRERRFLAAQPWHGAPVAMARPPARSLAAAPPSREGGWTVMRHRSGLGGPQN